MSGIIVVSAVLTASDVDVLNNTRLQTVPSNGYLTIECQADLNNATNNFAVSVQLPDGSTPLEAVPVPGNNPSLGGVIDDRQKLEGTFPVDQGGHAVIQFTETGAAIATFRITYTPA